MANNLLPRSASLRRFVAHGSRPALQVLVAAAFLFAVPQGDIMGADTPGSPDQIGSAQTSTAGTRVVHPASVDEAIALVRRSGRSVVMFAGFSGAGYDDPRAVERVIVQVLDAFNPASTVIAAGATPEGIGAAYALAKQRGFATIGIVSAVAEKEGAAFSPAVDVVYVIADDTWGGLGADGRLSPTSSAIVGAADEMIAIGGGEIARDEMVAARALGKRVRYFAADMNHAAAITKAREKRQADPIDFRGALAPHFDAETKPTAAQPK